MPNSNRKVDILILTYNHEKFIQTALDSILNQRTNFEFRLVIGDDRSTDGTADILKTYKSKFGEKIDFVINDLRLGIHGNFMKTWNRCDADYLAFCEGDDAWLTDSKLQRQIDFLETNKDFNLCASRSQIIHDNSAHTSNYPLKYSEYPSKSETIYLGMFHTASVVLRRGKTFDLPPWFPKTWIFDLPLWAYARQEGRSYVFPDLLAIYRLHSQGAWTSSSDLSRWDVSHFLYQKLSENLTDPEMKRLCIYQSALVQFQILIGNQRSTISLSKMTKDLLAFLSTARLSSQLGPTVPVRLLAYVTSKLCDKVLRQTKFLITGRRFP